MRRRPLRPTVARMAGPHTEREIQTFLLECFWPGVNEEQTAAVAQRARRAAHELSREGRRVRYLGSQLVPGDEVVFFEVEAESQDVASEVGQRAGLPFERVVASVRVPASRTRQGRTS